jgi:VacB/RNase II family 3'-5' exoribonuclease
MRFDAAAVESLDEGLVKICEEQHVPQDFPPEVVVAAEEAATRDPSTDRVDRTDTHFATIDPAASTDLDQAFAIERAGNDIVLHYAIADVGYFVRPGDPLDNEAWQRGVTVYLPGHRASLYPPALSEGAASLLPDGPRPAVVFTVRVDSEGGVVLDGCERALVHSRAKLAYDTVTANDLPDGFVELSQRIAAAEVARGAPRVDFPEQELERDGDGWEMSFRPRLSSEDDNAAMSLATNMAVADVLFAAHTGLFRVMPEPDERQLERLRHSARALGLGWPKGVGLDEFERSLPRDDPRGAAFLIAVRRASGGASYETYREGEKPWHGAMQATYAHATAPLRRLADRYVIEATLAVANDQPVPGWVTESFDRLPKAMSHGESVANRAERAAIELAEAVILADRVGDVFDAVVIDETDRGVQIQLADLPIIASVQAHHIDPGEDLRVRVDRVDVTSRQVEFTRVS